MVNSEMCQVAPAAPDKGRARLPVLFVATVALVVAVALVADLEGRHPGRSSRAGPAATLGSPPTPTSSATPATTATPTPTAPATSTPTTGPGAAVGSVRAIGSAAGETFVQGEPWLPAARQVGGRTPALVTTFHSIGGGPDVAVLRLDMSLVRVAPYAGTSQPGGTWSHEGSIASPLQPSLVAAFNGGFQFNASAGGWYADGRAGLPLRSGAASLVVHADGTASVDEWGRDAVLGPDVVAVRQNLSLLVDGGVPVPSAGIPGLWGATLGHLTRTWRSAVADDGRGGLLYVGGPGLDPGGLAAVLVGVGARRAMEFDINPQWVLGVTCTSGPLPGSIVTSKLLANMFYPANHFLVPGWRDFVAAFARPSTPHGVS